MITIKYQNSIFDYVFEAIIHLSRFPINLFSDFPMEFLLILE